MVEVLPLAEHTRRYVQEILALCQGDKTQAAKLLGIGRATLFRWLKEERLVAERRTGMTKGQHHSIQQLGDAERRYLREYGWRETSGKWFHPRVKESAIGYPQNDAVIWTKAHPEISW